MWRGARAASIAAVLLLLWPGTAQAKSYSFPKVEIEATILPDGSLELVEQRTFDFDGDFTFAYFSIDWPPSLIEEFQVSEHGVPLTASPGVFTRPSTATWYFDAHDEVKTFRISYRVRCAVEVFSDAAHLLWQFVGTGWDHGTEAVRVVVHLPAKATGATERATEPCEDPGFPFTLPPPSTEPVPETVPLGPREARAWGHGPLGGGVRFLDPQTVEYTIRDLEAETFLEGSILLPPESVPFAYQAPEAKRAQILNEEGALAAAANEARRSYMADRRAARILLFVVPLAMIMLVVVAFRRDRVPEAPRHLQEPPEELHPVELAHLWAAYRGRLIPKNAYRTQLLHLARIGAIELQPVGTVSDPGDFLIRLKKRPVEAGFDRDFVEFLFVDADDTKPVSLKELSAAGKRTKELRHWTKRVGDKTKDVTKRLAGAGVRWESWVLLVIVIGTVTWVSRSTGASLSQVLASSFGSVVAVPIVLVLLWGFRTRNFLVPVIVLAFALPIVIPLITLVHLSYELDLSTALVGLTVVGWLLSLLAMPERLPIELRLRMQRWAAFRRFLKGFSSLPAAPALAVIVWEHYLVDAVALDVAKQVEKQVREVVPEQDLPSPFAGAPTGLHGLGWMHTFNTSFAPASTFSRFAGSSSGAGHSFSSGAGSFSSGGGGGGGFSGGGGGGGGGTGGGAG